MAKVEAPNKEYSGPGPGGATFEKGVAEVEDEAALNYYRDAGYKVSGKVQDPPGGDEQPDPRDLEPEQVIGTRLRDAAVDPKPGDFLPPINAGKANPHGPAVVAPEVHGSGPAGLRPGEVHVDNLRKQATRETAFAEARLVDGVTAGEAVKAEVPDLDERGPIGLSDPGSADAGKRDAKGEDGGTGDTAAEAATASRKTSRRRSS